MKNFLYIVIVGLCLAGCQTTTEVEPRLPDVTVSGPTFPASTFDCAVRPLPPDPDTVGNKAASAAAHYENRLGSWGQGCQNRLQSVGRELNAAGQVAK